MSHRLYSSNIGRIVDPSGKGDFTTITAALAATTTGQIFIRPGTYTENLTLKANVNLCSFECNAVTPSVTIVGKLTATFAGTCSLSGLRLQTNSDNILSITGSAATIVNLYDCYINASNATAIVSTTSDTGNKINLYNCVGDLGTTGIAYFSIDHGTLGINYCQLYNSGVSAAQSVCANDASFNIRYSYFFNAISHTSSSTSTIYDTLIALGGAAVVPVTTSGTGTVSIRRTRIESGSSSSISIGTGTTVQATSISVDSSNTNAITGLGTLQYTDVMFTGTSNLINTTTQTASYVNLGKYKASGQPAFLAYVNTTITDVTGDSSSYQIIFDTEVFDSGGDFNLGTSTFTAPVTGKYSFTLSLLLGGGTALSATSLRITTTGNTFQRSISTNAGVTTSASGEITVVAPMTAGDTATFQVTATDSGGKIDDVNGVTGGIIRTWVSGHLVC